MLKSTISYHHKRILICPLDWGLGHAARCVPIIKLLQAQNNEVVIGCTASQKKFFEGEVSGVEFVELFGYGVSYSKWFPLWAKMLWQSPRLFALVKKEHKWLENYLHNHKVDVVISDNRYGLYNKKIISVFITHQLFIPAPVFAKRVNKINLDYIQKFSACWVPDYESADASLSGRLSHNKQVTKNISFIGPLSRFTKSTASDKKYDVLLLLSGAESQRTLLEEKLVSFFTNTNLKIALVRGSEVKGVFASNFSVFNIASTSQLQELFAQSKYIVCRSGYSTLMDLDAIGRKALLIPTPGQSEQEYLAEYWHSKFGFPIFSQKELTREKVMAALNPEENPEPQKQSV